MLMISLMDIDPKGLHSHAHKLLRECLRAVGVAYSENTPVIKGEMGKPSLKEYPYIHYNLSHARGISACIVSEEECGIDCEMVREYRPNVAKRVFSDSELKMLDEASGSEKDLIFFRLWTLKEAYVKTVGIGISYPMNTVEFSFEGNEIFSNIKDCRFRQYLIGGSSYVVSVCEQKKT